jgi:hypothetical protein
MFDRNIFGLQNGFLFVNSNVSYMRHFSPSVDTLNAPRDSFYLCCADIHLKWRPGFEPESRHVGSSVDRAPLGQVSSEYFGFPCHTLNPLIDPHSSPSIIQCCYNWLLNGLRISGLCSTTALWVNTKPTRTLVSGLRAEFEMFHEICYRLSRIKIETKLGISHFRRKFGSRLHMAEARVPALCRICGIYGEICDSG